MDIYIQYDALERAAQNLRVTAIVFDQGVTDLERAKTLFNNGAWRGQTADSYIERLDQDIMFARAYSAMLSQLATILDQSAQALRDKDAELQASIPG